MNQAEFNHCIPYWDDDDEEENLPSTVIRPRDDIPLSGHRLLLDEVGVCDVLSCFAERL